MNLLAIEFSSSQRSIAVLQTKKPVGPARKAEPCSPSAYSIHEVIETANCGARGGSGTPVAPVFAMIEQALRAAALEREQIECIALGVGPGSYSGIRSAIALAQGWQLASPQLKLRAVSGAECLAAQAHAQGMVGQIRVVIDAQRNEFYLAGFEISPENWRETQPLHLATFAEVQICARSGVMLLGPEITKWFPAGQTLFPRAANVAVLALNRTDLAAPGQLEPIYLRETQFVKAAPPRSLPK